MILARALLLATAAATVGCGSPSTRSGAEGSGEPGPVVRVSAQPVVFDLDVPAFSMVDQKGRPTTRADLVGKVWIANFIFTTCPTICPRLTEKMASLAARTKDDPGLRFLSITVDPENDTPPVLDMFAARYGVDAERWRFLTGDPKHVEDTVLKGFKMALQKQGQAVVFHAERFVLLDKRGHMRGVFDTEPADLDRLLARVRELEAE